METRKTYIQRFLNVKQNWALKIDRDSHENPGVQLELSGQTSSPKKMKYPTHLSGSSVLGLEGF